MKHLFLDLEDTVITPVMNGWFNTQLINVDKIKSVLETFKPDFVNVFSFAIWNQHELERFNQGTRPMIENAFGFKFNMVPTVDDDITKWCCHEKGFSHERTDFMEISTFWGKHESFRLTCRHLFKTQWQTWQRETHVMLLDDAVNDEKFEWPDIHIHGMIVNIDNFKISSH